jgi:hypothetical protein
MVEKTSFLPPNIPLLGIVEGQERPNLCEAKSEGRMKTMGSALLIGMEMEGWVGVELPQNLPSPPYYATGATGQMPSPPYYATGATGQMPSPPYYTTGATGQMPSPPYYTTGATGQMSSPPYYTTGATGYFFLPYKTPLFISLHQ